jgi:hypothetical protein
LRWPRDTGCSRRRRPSSPCITTSMRRARCGKRRDSSRRSPAR